MFYEQSENDMSVTHTSNKAGTFKCEFRSSVLGLCFNMLTFLTTASGVSFFGIASAFWGIVVGLVALLANRTIKEEPNN
jgi:tetrahydromethanopterin S-methyltransferase subunit E